MKRCAENARQRFSHPLEGSSPSDRIIHSVSIFSLLLLLLNSVSMTSAYDTGGSYDMYDNLAINTSVSLIADEEGYLTKVMTPEGQAQYLNRGDGWVDHEVQSGDTLSVIAFRYGLSMETIKDANSSLSNANYLKISQILRIPPADGVLWEIEEGDTLGELYDELFDGDDEERELALQRTLEINALSENATLETGDEIFVVGGERPAPVYVATEIRSDDLGIRDDTTRVTHAPSSVSVVSAGSGWVQPTTGTITQWYSSWHYAIDISQVGAYVVAAREGTVTRAESDGGWHGGYGNVIEIDHGQTELGYCKTLYAHNSTVYAYAGQYVSAGEVLSVQGSTGRTYGRTGIHLHVEVVCDGVKINPSFLFGY